VSAVIVTLTVLFHFMIRMMLDWLTATAHD